MIKISRLEYVNSNLLNSILALTSILIVRNIKTSRRSPCFARAQSHEKKEGDFCRYFIRFHSLQNIGSYCSITL